MREICEGATSFRHWRAADGASSGRFAGGAVGSRVRIGLKGTLPLDARGHFWTKTMAPGRAIIASGPMHRSLHTAIGGTHQPLCQARLRPKLDIRTRAVDNREQEICDDIMTNLPNIKFASGNIEIRLPVVQACATSVPFGPPSPACERPFGKINNTIRALRIRVNLGETQVAAGNAFADTGGAPWPPTGNTPWSRGVGRASCERRGLHGGARHRGFAGSREDHRRMVL
jgi:hypothetical protein